MSHRREFGMTVAPGIAALYAVPMSSRVTGLAACVIVVLMTFSNAVTAAAPPRRYRVPGLVRLWPLAMLRRSAPLGRLQPGIVALALAGTMRCPVMPP